MEQESTTTPSAPTSAPESSSSSGSGRGVQVWQRSESAGPRESTPQTQTQQVPANVQQAQQPSQVQPQGGQPLHQDPKVIAQARQQGIDPKELAKAIVEAQHQATQSQKPAYTPDQFKKDFGIFEMDGPTFEGMFGVEASPERIEAFNHVLKRTVGMAVKMATFQAKQEIAKIESSLNPIKATFTEAQNRAAYNKFATSYPELKSYSSVVQSVVAQMKAQGLRFNTVDEAISAAAQRTKAMLQQSGVQIQAQPPQQQQPRQKQPAMVSTGGSVGTGRSTSSTQGSRGIAVLKKSMGR